MRKTGLIALLGLLPTLLPQAAWAQNLQAQVEACRRIAEAAARLGCYDKIDAKSAAAADAAAHAAANAAIVAAEVRRATAEAVAAAKPARDEVVESHIPGTFQGWEPNQAITLANGQVWKIVDGSTAWFANLVNPKVRISTSVFGAVTLQIEGQNHAPRVRRVK